MREFRLYINPSDAVETVLNLDDIRADAGGSSHRVEGRAVVHLLDVGAARADQLDGVGRSLRHRQRAIDRVNAVVFRMDITRISICKGILSSTHVGDFSEIIVEQRRLTDQVVVTRLDNNSLLQGGAVVGLGGIAAGHSDVAAGHVHREIAVGHRVVRVGGANLDVLRAFVNVRHGSRSGGPGAAAIQTVRDVKGIRGNKGAVSRHDRGKRIAVILAGSVAAGRAVQKNPDIRNHAASRNNHQQAGVGGHAVVAHCGLHTRGHGDTVHSGNLVQRVAHLGNGAVRGHRHGKGVRVARLQWAGREAGLSKRIAVIFTAIAIGLDGDLLAVHRQQVVARSRGVVVVLGLHIHSQRALAHVGDARDSGAPSVHRVGTVVDSGTSGHRRRGLV